MRKVTLLLIAFIPVLFHSCHKDENDKVKFGWVKGGNRLYYDYYSPTDTIRDCRYLLILDNLFMENNPSSTDNFGMIFNILNRDHVVKKGGLYGLACENCDMGPLVCLNEFEFLYAPNAPALHQELPEYGCGRTPRWHNRIINVDTTITVPMGTFKTYVMQHYAFGDRSYWNPDEGLIRYDSYDGRGNLKGSLRLNRILR